MPATESGGTIHLGRELDLAKERSVCQTVAVLVVVKDRAKNQA